MRVRIAAPEANAEEMTPVSLPALIAAPFDREDGKCKMTLKILSVSLTSRWPSGQRQI
jgi:hypothetical protein